MSRFVGKYNDGSVSEKAWQGDITKNVKGNAMIYVLIVVMILTLMLTMLLNISGYERTVTKSYRDYANLHDMAVSGAEAVLEIFNNVLAVRSDAVLEKTATDLSIRDYSTVIEYINHSANVYEGNFYLPKSIFSNTFAANADKEIMDGLKKDYGVDDNTLFFEFDFEVEDGDSYRIEVEVVFDEATSPVIYNVNSTVIKEAGGLRSSVSATIVCSAGRGVDVYNDIIIPNFTWNNTPGWAMNAVNPNYSESDFYLPAITYPVAAERYNSVYVIMNSGTNVIDIAKFYEDEDAIPTIIISLASDDLMIATGDTEHNIFRGIIFSAGNITIEEGKALVMEGSLIAIGDISLSDDCSVINMNDMLFTAEFSDETLRKRVHDFFRATDFNKGGDVFNAKISTGGSYIIKNMSDVRYYITRLTTTYR